MRRIALVALMLMYMGCAPVEDESVDSAPLLEEQELAVLGTWTPGEEFDQVTRFADSYMGTTPGGYAKTLSSANTEYWLHGTVRNGDTTRFVHTSVWYSVRVTALPNKCVTQGCTFVLCFENVSRGWGTCTAAPPSAAQGSNSWTLDGTTSFFSGLVLGSGESGRWSLYVTTSGWWPSSATFNDFTVVAFGGP